MSTPINDAEEFLKRLCKVSGVQYFDNELRACVIVRSPANYGREGSVIIEWEGSPPRYTIIYQVGIDPYIGWERVHWKRSIAANNEIRAFLEDHPANEDGSPVWVGTRHGDEPIAPQPTIHDLLKWDFD
jgi:hypothetical protein